MLKAVKNFCQVFCKLPLSSEKNVLYLEQAVRKKPSKRLVQNSSSANSSLSRVRLPVSKCRKMSLKAKSLNVSTIKHGKERDRD